MTKKERIHLEDMENDLSLLRKELLEVYEYLYPDAKIKNPTIIQSRSILLGFYRHYHKEQLEKEKIKKLVKECLGEIEHGN